ncbi:MAG: hypothetical protein G8345_01280 [Magnetococcales bacterium]|nr:antA/AntB antirepressor family protein [Magnetococcales bacterium]NGZ25503.1 hypothetical protein [Magnetococcales bacterium]
MSATNPSQSSNDPGQSIPVFWGMLGEKPMLVCDALSLYTFLGIGHTFPSLLMIRIEEHYFKEYRDFIITEVEVVPAHASPTGRARWRYDYHLSLTMARELAMLENKQKGRLLRQYFMDCEQNLSQPALLSPPAELPAPYSLNDEVIGAACHLLLALLKLNLPQHTHSQLAKLNPVMVQGITGLVNHYCQLAQRKSYPE